MKNFKGFTAGVLCGAIVMGAVPTIAKVGKEAIDVVYNNIKVEVNGIKTTMPKGVEPFMYNGTTYLPVRAVAEALGEKVEYDKKTSTVYVGSRTEKPNDGSVRLMDYIEKKPLLGESNRIYIGDEYYSDSNQTATPTQYIMVAKEKIGFDSVLYAKGAFTGANGASVTVKTESNFSKLKAKMAIIDKNKSSGVAAGKLRIYSLNSDGSKKDILFDTDDYIKQYGTFGKTSGSYGYLKGEFEPFDIEIDLVGIDRIMIQVYDEAALLDPVLIPLK